MSEKPTSWTSASLSDLGDLYCGQSPQSSTVNRAGIGTPYVTGPEQWDGTVLHSPKWTTDPRCEVPADTIFITVKGAGVGKVFPGIACAIGRDVYAYAPAKELDQRFMLTAVSSIISKVKTAARGDIPGLTRSDLLNPIIGLPPLAQQRRIVAKLDALSARSKRARAELERVEVLAERARQAVLAKFVTPPDDGVWPLVRIGDVTEVITGGTPAAAEKEKSFGDVLPFFKPGDLDAGYYTSIAREHLSEFGAAKARVVPAMSVLVTCIGSIGKTGLARVRCSTNQQINALVCSPSIDPRWLYWRVVSNDFQEQLRVNSSATTLAIINKSRLQSLVLALPPLEQQIVVVGVIEAAMRRISHAVGHAAQGGRLLDRLDQSILSRAFRGELVPQDPNDEPASVLLDRIRAERAAGGDTPRPRRRAG